MSKTLVRLEQVPFFFFFKKTHSLRCRSTPAPSTPCCCQLGPSRRRPGADRRDDDRGEERRAASAGGASKLHVDLATGTGTDRYCIAAPSSGRRAHVGEPPHEARRVGRPRVTQRARSKRCAGRTVSKRATREACFTRSAATVSRRRRCSKTSRHFSANADLALLKKNAKAAFYEPLVGAAAHALATVCDRVRYGTIPSSSPPMRRPSTPRRWRPISRRRSIAGPSSVRLLRPHANGDVKSLGPQGTGARLVGKVADAVIQLLPVLLPNAGRSPSRSRPMRLLAIQSMRGIRCGSLAGR